MTALIREQTDELARDGLIVLADAGSFERPVAPRPGGSLVGLRAKARSLSEQWLRSALAREGLGLGGRRVAMLSHRKRRPTTPKPVSRKPVRVA